MYDVFLSYRHCDVGVVSALADALGARGLSVWMDRTAIPEFGGITDAARRGIAGSKAIVAFYSASYPQSAPCQWELTTAFAAAGRLGDPRARVLVVNPEPTPNHIEPVELRDALYQRLEVTDATRIDQVAKAIAAHVATLDGTLGAGDSVPALWVPAQPAGAPHFVGRLPEMWRVHSALHASEAAMTQGAFGPGIAVVSGLGGTGKSLLAREYALRFAGAFPGGVFWLVAQGADESADPVELEGRRRQHVHDVALAVLGPGAVEHLDPDDLEVAVRAELSRRPPCLWVIDDLPAGLTLEQVTAWLGPGAARTLVTTRSREYGGLASDVQLGMLSDDEGLEVLGAHRAPADDAERHLARQIVAELGGHALALDVTGALLRFESYAELLDGLQRPDYDSAELAARLHGHLPTGHERSISATLHQSLGRLGADGHAVIDVAAALTSDPIPISVFFEVVARADDVGVEEARPTVLRGLDEAETLSLLDRPRAGSWQLHPLVARTVRTNGGRTARHGAMRHAAIVALISLLGDPAEPGALVRALPLLGHARALATGDLDASEYALLAAVGMFDLAVGDAAGAHAHFSRLVDLDREALGPFHSNTLTAMGNLAISLRLLGDLDAAHPIEENVVTAQRTFRGDRHPDTLTAMGNLAVTAWALGDLDRARALEEDVLAGRREMWGDRHPDTLTAMGNLAATAARSGDLDRARALEEEVLAGRREMWGDRHPYTLTAMGNLAVTLRRLGDLTQARDLEEEVLAGRREMWGDRHPDTLTAMGNLAVTLRKLGDLDGARTNAEGCLDGRRALGGDRHPDTLTAVGNLAIVLRKLGDLEGALGFGKACLDGRRAVRGDRHPETVTAMGNLAITLRALGDVAGARALEEEARSVRP
jgi:tetratricopeptide (TPR) repeat protein